jgi:hypothetical protein
MLLKSKHNQEIAMYDQKRNLFIKRSRRAVMIGRVKTAVLVVAIAVVLLWATTCNLTLTSSCW